MQHISTLCKLLRTFYSTQQLYFPYLNAVSQAISVPNKQIWDKVWQAQQHKLNITPECNMNAALVYIPLASNAWNNLLGKV